MFLKFKEPDSSTVHDPTPVANEENTSKEEKAVANKEEKVVANKEKADNATQKER